MLRNHARPFPAEYVRKYRLVAQEPSREPIGRVEVGKDDVFETFAHRRCRSRPTGFVTHETFLVYPDLHALL